MQLAIKQELPQPTFLIRDYCELAEGGATEQTSFRLSTYSSGLLSGLCIPWLVPNLIPRLVTSQAAAHEEVLGRFERDMDALAAAELHPAACAGGAIRLLDLLPEAKLRDWAANCSRAHRQFADKV